MKRSVLFLLTIIVLAALPLACNKQDKEQLADLEDQKAELESTVVDLPEASQAPLNNLPISFDEEYYWVDAAGSVTLHYNLSSPASVEAIAEEGWNATVSSLGDREGTIVVTWFFKVVLDVVCLTVDTKVNICR